MATRFESVNSEYAGRNSVSLGSAHTFGGYFYVHSLPSSGNYAPIIMVWDGPGFAGYSVAVDSAGHLRIIDYSNDAISSAGSATVSTGTWYYLWVRDDGTSFGTVSVYFNLSTTADVTKTLGMATTARVEFATNEAGSTSTNIPSHWYGDLSLDAWKGWSIDRAASNATAESASHSLVSSTSAIAAWYFDGTDVTDHSGNSRDLTASGTLSAGPDSPIDSASGISGTASGSIAFTGSAADTVLIQALASGSYLETGTAQATVLIQALAAGALPLSGSATALGALPELFASASGSFLLDGSAIQPSASGAGGSIPRGRRKKRDEEPDIRGGMLHLVRLLDEGEPSETTPTRTTRKRATAAAAAMATGTLTIDSEEEELLVLFLEHFWR
jgi:hypothetical protein